MSEPCSDLLISQMLFNYLTYDKLRQKPFHKGKSLSKLYMISVERFSALHVKASKDEVMC